jgi:WD40 repeat protein
LSPDSQYLATAGSAPLRATNSSPQQPFILKLWGVNTRSLEAEAPFGHNGKAPRITFSPDGRTVVVSDFSQLQFHRVPSLQLLAAQGERGAVFSRDGSWFAYLDENQIWKRASLDSPPHLLLTAPATIGCLSLSTDGSTLAGSTSSGEIHLWDSGTGRHLGRLTGHDQRAVALPFAPHTQMLVSAAWDGRLGFWELPRRRLLAFLRGHNGAFNCASFSPDGRTLATGGDDNELRLWNVARRQEVLTLHGHTDAVNGVAFSADGQWLASGSDDGKVRLWHAPASPGL